MITANEASDYPRMHDRYVKRMVAANNTRIPVHGKKDLGLVIAGVGTRLLEATVGEIKRNLMSVNDLVECGNTVIFDKHNPRIVDAATGRSIPMIKRNSVYDVEFELEPFSSVPRCKTRSRG